MLSGISHGLLVKARRAAGLLAHAKVLIHATANYYLVKLGRSESAVYAPLKPLLYTLVKSSYGASMMRARMREALEARGS